jgi:hypothetical protein
MKFINDKLGAELFVGEYVKFPYVVANCDCMEVPDKAVKSTMTPFSVPVDCGAIVGSQKRLDKNGSYLGLDVEIGGYFENTYMPCDLPYSDLDLPSIEEVRVQGSVMLIMPFNECVMETAYSYHYDSFDKQRHSGLFDVLIVNNAVDFATKEVTVVRVKEHIWSSCDLHPRSHASCIREEVLKTSLLIRYTVCLSVCRAAQSQVVTNLKEGTVTRTTWLMQMHQQHTVNRR